MKKNMIIIVLAIINLILVGIICYNNCDMSKIEDDISTIAEELFVYTQSSGHTIHNAMYRTIKDEAALINDSEVYTIIEY